MLLGRGIRSKGGLGAALSWGCMALAMAIAAAILAMHGTSLAAVDADTALTAAAAAAAATTRRWPAASTAHLDLPPRPQFSAAQKKAQREHGLGLVSRCCLPPSSSPPLPYSVFPHPLSHSSCVCRITAAYAA
eukprot:COSAG02_NODE_37841_length_437_cov_0.446746_1_plen_132_part_01